MFDVLEKHYKNKHLHHAYLLVGEKQKVRGIVNKISSKILLYEGSLASHPDFFEYEADSIGIRDGHKIKRRAFLSPQAGGAKIFYIASNYFTKEAENTLLKLLEEPPEGTYFFINTSSLDNLSLVLRSRLNILIDNKKNEISGEKRDFLIKFLKLKPYKRLEAIKNIMGDKERTKEFIRGLEMASVSLADKRYRNSVMEDIQLVRSMLEQPILSCRLILEHLALSLPRLQK